MADRSQNLATLRSVFAAVAAADADAVVSHYTEDYVLELPYGNPGAPVVVEGRAVVRDHLASAFEVFRFTLEVTAVHDTVDPDLVIAEYVSSGHVLPSGRPYANRYVGFWWFRDGLVVRTREYYDPMAARLALDGG